MINKIVTRSASQQVFYIVSIGVLGAFLFLNNAFAAPPLPPQCPGTVSDYNLIEGGPSDDTLSGTSGNDFIFGNGGSDSINGRGGNDCILADGGTDTVVTGSGNDVILVGGENNSIHAGDGHNVVVSGDGRDNITTGSGDDRIMAGSGNNSIRSGGGNDVIIAGSGNDYINAGSGDDQCFSGTGRNIVTGCELNDESGEGAPPETEEDDIDDSDTGDESDGGNTDGGNTDDQEDEGDITDDEPDGDDESNDDGVNSTSSGAIQFVGGGVPPVEVREGAISVVAPGHIIISWKTNIPATSQVVYGSTSHPDVDPAPEYGYDAMTVEKELIDTNHSVEITGLDPGTSYFFRPVSDISNSTEGIGSELAYVAPPIEPIIEEASLSVLSEGNAIVALNSNSEGEALITVTRDEENTIATKSSVGDEDDDGIPVLGTVGNDIDKDTNSGLALLLGVLPLTGGQFFLLLLVILLIAIIIWFVASRTKREIRSH